MKRLLSVLMAMGLALPFSVFVAGCEQAPEEQVEEEMEDVQEEREDVIQEQHELQEEQQELDQAQDEAVTPAEPNGINEPDGALVPETDVD